MSTKMTPFFSKHEIWISSDGSKQKIKLPVLPEKIQVQRGSSNNTIDIADVGEVTIIQRSPAVMI